MTYCFGLNLMIYSITVHLHFIVIGTNYYQTIIESMAAVITIVAIVLGVQRYFEVDYSIQLMVVNRQRRVVGRNAQTHLEVLGNVWVDFVGSFIHGSNYVIGPAGMSHHSWRRNCYCFGIQQHSTAANFAND